MLHCSVNDRLTGTRRCGAMDKSQRNRSKPHLVAVTRDGIAAEVSRPDPAKRVAGNPAHTTWNIEHRDGHYCGIWQSPPGRFRVDYTEWEYVFIREGISNPTDDLGHPITLRAGDSMIIRPGFRRVWTVVETTVKDCVIRV